MVSPYLSALLVLLHALCLRRLLDDPGHVSMIGDTPHFGHVFVPITQQKHVTQTNSCSQLNCTQDRYYWHVTIPAIEYEISVINNTNTYGQVLSSVNIYKTDRNIDSYLVQNYYIMGSEGSQKTTLGNE